MIKSRMKMCDGSEYTVFYLNKKQTPLASDLKVNDLKPNKAGHVFEPHLLNKKGLSLLYKFLDNSNNNKNQWDI